MLQESAFPWPSPQMIRTTFPVGLHARTTAAKSQDLRFSTVSMTPWCKIPRKIIVPRRIVDNCSNGRAYTHDRFAWVVQYRIVFTEHEGTCSTSSLKSSRTLSALNRSVPIVYLVVINCSNGSGCLPWVKGWSRVTNQFQIVSWNIILSRVAYRWLGLLV